MNGYLSEAALRRAFAASGKRHLILTGGRGAGKTTLIKTLCPEILPGITTRAVPKEAVYVRNNLTGEQKRIGVFDPSIPGPENRMKPDGLKEHLLPMLESVGACSGEWVTADEIGYLESEDEDCRRACRSLFEKKRVLAVLRKQDTPLCREILARDDVFIADLDTPFGSMGCVIMASGLGSRFASGGSGNKLTADFCGKPLISWVMDTASGLFLRITVVTRYEEVVRIAEERGISAVFHSLPQRSDTVRLGLEKMHGTDGCLFCQGDQPLLTRESAAAMLLCGRNDGNSAYRLAWNGTGASPVLFPSQMYPDLMNLPDGKGGGWLLKKYPDRVKCVEAADPSELADIDTPEDLEKLRKIQKRREEK